MLIGKRQVKLTDLDGNGHVYNATYADIASDFLAEQEFSKNIDNFRINYVSEAMLNDIIEIYSEKSENKIVIIGKIKDRISFETEFIRNNFV